MRLCAAGVCTQDTLSMERIWRWLSNQDAQIRTTAT